MWTANLQSIVDAQRIDNPAKWEVKWPSHFSHMSFLYLSGSCGGLRTMVNKEGGLTLPHLLWPDNSCPPEGCCLQQERSPISPVGQHSSWGGRRFSLGLQHKTFLHTMVPILTAFLWLLFKKGTMKHNHISHVGYYFGSC